MARTIASEARLAQFQHALPIETEGEDAEVMLAEALPLIGIVMRAGLF